MTQRLENMLFNYETTLKTDYRSENTNLCNEYKVHKPNINFTLTYQKARSPRKKYIPLKDLNALHEFRIPSEIPFSLFHRVKPVVRSNPKDKQEVYTELEDVDLPKVRKTRPRLVMTPALSLDDVEEPDHTLLLNCIYSTTYRSMCSNIQVAPVMNAPSGMPYAAAKPIRLEPLRVDLVSPEWRMQSVSWDNEQLRSYASPTCKFWLDRKPNKAPTA